MPILLGFHAAGLFRRAGRHNQEPRKTAEFRKNAEFFQKVFDRLKSPPYRPVHRSGAATRKGLKRYGRQQIRTAVPGIKIGEALLSASFVVWLFDIVGFR
jgi:hypothetical protein